MKAKWVARNKKDNVSSSGTKEGHQGRGYRREQGQGGHGYNGARADERMPPPHFDLSEVKCFNCNKYGHIAKDCLKPIT